MTCTRCSREIDADSAFCRYCGAPAGGPPPLPRRLTRLPEQGKIAGVCAGLAAYFNTDPTLVRLAWVVLSIVPGAIVGGLVAYLIAWIVLPSDAGVPLQPFGGRQLLRSTSNRKVAGVCGGLAEYLGVDSTIVRLAWVVLSIYPGAIVCGLIAYLIAWIVIPSASEAALEPAGSTP
jgi:phage shock protein PspC (stress-responsive transcriptional regulator)